LGSAGDGVEDVEDVGKEKTGVREAYRQLWAVVRLPAMRSFTGVLICCRLGMLPAEQVPPPLASPFPLPVWTLKRTPYERTVSLPTYLFPLWA